ncbi:MAG TPA: diaminopimelate decarboxylase [Stellaceae bacterium]|nr:diaminopimelate decarboxylase [Stellaceae bacterium]
MSEAFAYRNGELYAEEIAVARVAEAVGTPFYLYSAASFSAQYRALSEALGSLDPLICYAVKANSNQAVLRLFAGLGAGADVVSEGELRRALAAGIPADRIVFSGVGKSRSELDYALAADIHQINVESVPELRRLSSLAAASGRTARVAIRVNPDVDAGGHRGISTGREGDKFGIARDDATAAYRLARDLPGIEPVGLAVHIGSKIESIAPSRTAFERIAELVTVLRDDGMAVRRVDLGGGLTIPYGDGHAIVSPADYAGLVREVFGALDLALAFEPGRFLVGAGGVLVSAVEYVKEGAGHPVVVLDAAMNDLIRPALYEAFHAIVPVRQAGANAVPISASVVGPVCESTDTFTTEGGEKMNPAKVRDLPPLGEGDLVVFKTAGAYGATMSSTYNTRPLVPEVMVSGDRFAVIRARPSHDALLGLDAVPDWLLT